MNPFGRVPLRQLLPLFILPTAAVLADDGALPWQEVTIDEYPGYSMPASSDLPIVDVTPIQDIPASPSAFNTAEPPFVPTSDLGTGTTPHSNSTVKKPQRLAGQQEDVSEHAGTNTGPIGRRASISLPIGPPPTGNPLEAASESQLTLPSPVAALPTEYFSALANVPPGNGPTASPTTTAPPRTADSIAIAPPPTIEPASGSFSTFTRAFSTASRKTPIGQFSGGNQPTTSGDIALVRHVQPCDGCDGQSCCKGCGGCCHSCMCPLPEAPCVDCPRINMQNPYFNVSLFGALKLDMLFNGPRQISPGTPFFLAPGPVPGLSEQTFDAHARQSTLGAALAGPTVGGFQSGGLILATFYNDAIIVDQYGFLPLQAYGELTSSDTRFAAGLQFDVFCPGAPTVLPFSVLNASGNPGNAFRGQVRFERFIRPSSDRQWTLQLALSEPIASTIDPLFRLAEDNGWPNIEARIALGCGCLPQTGAAARRPVEVGVSTVVGQLRTTLIGSNQVVADVWGLGIDYFWKITDQIGVAGELFTGQGLGTYNAGVLQGINPNTGRAIEASGGWIEFFAYWSPCLHSHYGFGVDNPNDNQIAPRGRTKNETYFANLIWDMNSTFRIGCELAYRDTDYLILNDNNGFGFHTQFQWTF